MFRYPLNVSLSFSVLKLSCGGLWEHRCEGVGSDSWPDAEEKDPEPKETRQPDVVLSVFIGWNIHHKNLCLVIICTPRNEYAVGSILRQLFSSVHKLLTYVCWCFWNIYNCLFRYLYLRRLCCLVQLEVKWWLVCISAGAFLCSPVLLNVNKSCRPFHKWMPPELYL